MQRIPFCGGDLSDREVERPIGQARTARLDFLRDDHRRVFRAIGLTVLACGFVVLLVMGAGSTRHQVLENTGVIERLATKLSRIATIDPRTQHVVAQLLQRSDYDCRQIACVAWLEKRNAAARARLETILAKNSLPATVATKK